MTDSTSTKCRTCDRTLPEPHIQRIAWTGFIPKKLETVSGSPYCPRCILAKESRAIGAKLEAVASRLTNFEPDLGERYDHEPNFSLAFHETVVAASALLKIVEDTEKETDRAKAALEELPTQGGGA